VTAGPAVVPDGTADAAVVAGGPAPSGARWAVGAAGVPGQVFQVSSYGSCGTGTGRAETTFR
jgi:hypothetical protein